MLLEYVRTHPETAFHTALHFSNLLCVSEHLPVREAAGNALLSVAPDLLVDQINEIGIDLTRELESGQEQISRFIPPYLGRLLCLLPEKELGESVESIGKLACGASIRPARVALFTLGEALNVLPEQEAQIADHILGLILTGISHYDETIYQTALAVLCRDIFGRDQLSLARKHDIFVRLHKKLLTLLAEPRTGQLDILQLRGHAQPSVPLYRPAGAAGGRSASRRKNPPRFSPGTFDPFSVGHKQIVQEIRARGFEVYLAVDEFSWSKKTLPQAPAPPHCLHFDRRPVGHVSVPRRDPRQHRHVGRSCLPAAAVSGQRRLSCRGQRRDRQRLGVQAHRARHSCGL